MRSEQKMMKLIVQTAQEDARIRTVVMNGSRANPLAPRDIFQDFDIVYGVTDLAPFMHNLEWIKRFGELMILQVPEEMADPPPANPDCFVYLMQFMDGNRIDLTLAPLDRVNQLAADSLSLILLDKDGILAHREAANESDYLPQPPTAKQFADCCNEFWWVAPYAAKGLWREEILYARYILDPVMRDELMKMLRWYIGVKTGFALNPGKMGKYFQQYLEAELWEMLLSTYADASYAHTWEALLAMGRLFRKVAVPTAEVLGFAYPFEENRRVWAHLEHVRQLPRDAREIY